MPTRPSAVRLPKVSSVLAAAAVAALSASQAVAAEPGGGPAPAAPRIAAWDGGYWGVTLGLAGSNGEAYLDGFAGALIPTDVANGLFPEEIDDFEFSAIGGATLGYNRQHGKWVRGVELDLSAAGQDVELGFEKIDPIPSSPGYPLGGLLVVTGYETEVSSLATLRGRVGLVTAENLLVYGTLGVAAGHVENRFTLAIPDAAYSAPDWSESGVRWGYVLGAGVERKLSDRMSLKGEVLYYDLADVRVEGRDPVTPGFGAERINYSFDNDGLLLRVGLNFAF